MKKFIILSAFVLLAVGFKAEAAATTTGNGDPNAVYQAWGLSGYQTPVIKSGVTVTDVGGLKVTCENFMSHGCFNLVGTESYRNNMLSIARTLIATNQVSRFPSFYGWVVLAR